MEFIELEKTDMKNDYLLKQNQKFLFEGYFWFVIIEYLFLELSKNVNQYYNLHYYH